MPPLTEETLQLISELAGGEPEAEAYFTRLATTFGEDVIRRFRRVETEGLRVIGLRTRLCDVMDGIPEYLTDRVFETWLQRELGIEDVSFHDLWDEFGID